MNYIRAVCLGFSRKILLPGNIPRIFYGLEKVEISGKLFFVFYPNGKDFNYLIPENVVEKIAKKMKKTDCFISSFFEELEKDGFDSKYRVRLYSIDSIFTVRSILKNSGTEIKSEEINKALSLLGKKSSKDSLYASAFMLMFRHSSDGIILSDYFIRWEGCGVYVHKVEDYLKALKNSPFPREFPTHKTFQAVRMFMDVGAVDSDFYYTSRTKESELESFLRRAGQNDEKQIAEIKNCILEKYKLGVEEANGVIHGYRRDSSTAYGKIPIGIQKIEVIEGDTDLILITTDLTAVNGHPAVLKLEVESGRWESYAKINFPGVPVQKK